MSLILRHVDVQLSKLNLVWWFLTLCAFPSVWNGWLMRQNMFFQGWVSNPDPSRQPLPQILSDPPSADKSHWAVGKKTLLIDSWWLIMANHGCKNIQYVSYIQVIYIYISISYIVYFTLYIITKRVYICKNTSWLTITNIIGSQSPFWLGFT